MRAPPHVGGPDVGVGTGVDDVSVGVAIDV